MSAKYSLLLFPSFATKWKSKSAQAQPGFEAPQTHMHGAKKLQKRET
jgi:hypothetical protein